ncbi:hypothetical protein NC651_027983 [Populus alba x Populus x berolinensis]|nr:hypothetical protein NC651_027983 [Populus alba x Populus x berolinensis]
MDTFNEDEDIVCEAFDTVLHCPFVDSYKWTWILYSKFICEAEFNPRIPVSVNVSAFDTMLKSYNRAFPRELQGFQYVGIDFNEEQLQMFMNV